MLRASRYASCSCHAPQSKSELGERSRKRQVPALPHGPRLLCTLIFPASGLFTDSSLTVPTPIWDRVILETFAAPCLLVCLLLSPLFGNPPLSCRYQHAQESFVTTNNSQTHHFFHFFFSIRRKYQISPGENRRWGCKEVKGLRV